MPYLFLLCGSLCMTERIFSPQRDWPSVDRQPPYLFLILILKSVASEAELWFLTVFYLLPTVSSALPSLLRRATGIGAHPSELA